ncbi:4-oxalomesaconate tautomerase [Nonomuraea sp. NPDC049750]|uniref:4-oxalomesaconate tautomerase n=1 Tax=Nonomuraea sp. NPDC049750 TaxID=3154738 RepID=UPI00340EA300
MTSGGLRCALMRGGTSKGAYFLAEDLPADRAARDDLLLRVMGSPDPRQIDGLGGAHPLTSKVAVVSRSGDDAADVDYLFLQTGVETAEVSDRQNCGNLLAGVGPFAVERGLVPAGDGETTVRIRMLNTGELAAATFPTPGRVVSYEGSTEISGVPGTAAAIVIEFTGRTGDRPLLPTGRARDEVAGVEVTCVDNGMPVVLARAADLGITGYESPAALEGDAALAARLREIRLAAGKLMGLGDVRDTTVPKLTLLAPPRDGGAVCTRTFIPVRCHTAIGVLGAASVAAGLLLADGIGHDLAVLAGTGDRLSAEHPLAGTGDRLSAKHPLAGAGDRVRIEHPTGFLDVETVVEQGPSGSPYAVRTAVVRTARKIFDGTVHPRPSDS